MMTPIPEQQKDGNEEIKARREKKKEKKALTSIDEKRCFRKERSETGKQLRPVADLPSRAGRSCSSSGFSCLPNPEQEDEQRLVEGLRKDER
jgi:hypothetical protein